MKEHFAEQLEDLRRQLILMGGEVERQIHRSIEALTEMDPEQAQKDIQEADVNLKKAMQLRTEQMKKGT